MNPSKPLTDSDIIALYLARDEAAIEATQRIYGGYCLSVAMNILDSPADAEECVNDTYLKAWNTIPPQKPFSLKDYLGRLVRHLSIDRYRALRRAKRNINVTEALDELTVISPDTDRDNPALTEALNTFLSGLDTNDRNLFLGRYWYFYEVADLARAYGMTVNTVYVKLHRMRERLRKHLTERGFQI